MMTYGSVCSGIECATVAWHPLGWQPAWFSEIEPFPCRLLQHYYPHVPNLGDMLKIEHNEVFQRSAIDLLVGGTPCQSFSTAGLRGGLADDRGNLALEFCRILTIKQPRWFVWENVPGVFSSYSNETPDWETSDFASILTAFRECGYSCSWRVLDAQFCGVPQRRRRVFVVGHLGDDWRPSAAVLFEPEGLRRDPPTIQNKRKAITGTIGKRTGGRSIGAEEAGAGFLIAGTIDASYGRLQGASGQDSGHGHSTLVSSLTKRPYADNESNESKLIPYCRQMGHAQNVVPANGQAITENNRLPAIIFRESGQGYWMEDDKCGTLRAEGENRPSRPSHVIHYEVRRLTPLECERLQGFPDNYTAIPGSADSPRYESIGNSMAVPVMRRIGKRIDMVDKIFKSLS